MAGKTSINIAITATTGGLTAGLQSATVQVRQFGGDIDRAGGQVGGMSSGISALNVAMGQLAAEGMQAAIRGARQIIGLFAESITAASDYRETLNRFNLVFKDQAPAAEKWADTLAAVVGRAKGEVLDASASFRGLFGGLGFGGEEATKFSKQLTQLAIDFASVNNLADSEANRIFLAGLSGSSEVFDKYGINIKQAALQQELLNQGIRKTWGSVTEQEKAMARLAIIVRTMTEQGSVGDAIRTSKEWAAQMKQLDAAIISTKVAVGDALAPTLAKVMPEIIGFVKDAGAAFIELMTGSSTAGMDIGDTLREMVATARQAIPAIMSLINAWISRLEFLGGTALQVAGFVVSSFGRVEDFISKVRGTTPTMNLSELGKQMQSLGDDLSGDSFKRFGDAIGGATAKAAQKGIDDAKEAARQAAGGVLEDIEIPDIKASVGVDTAMMQKQMEDAAEQARAEADKIAKKWGGVANQMRTSTATPLENMRASVDEATEAFSRGVIDGTTYWRTIDKIRDGFLQATAASRQMQQSVGAVTEGSTAAFSAIQSSIRAAQSSNVEAASKMQAETIIRQQQGDTIKRLEAQQRVMQDQLVETRRQTAQLTAMNQELRRLPGLRVVDV